MGAERGAGFGVQLRHRQSVGGRDPLDEGAGQQLDVAFPIPQRWQHQDDDVEPVVEVLAELSPAHGLSQIDVRCRDDADIDLPALLSADPANAASLQGAQQLRLELQRQRADLVQEQRAAVGELEETRAWPQPPR